MKVSEWLRTYQLSGVVPEIADDPWIPFWAGWLMGNAVRVKTPANEALETAIKAAEFIEEHGRC